MKASGDISDLAEKRVAFANVCLFVGTYFVGGMVALGSLGAVYIGTLVAGEPPPKRQHPTDSYASDWVGHSVLAMPWWPYALVGLLLLVVIVVAWRPEYRFVPPPKYMDKAYYTTPAPLTALMLGMFVLIAYSVPFHGYLASPLSPYWIGGYLCLTASVVGGIRWMLDDRRAESDRPDDEPRPGLGARVISWIWAITVVTFVVIGFLGVPLNQLAYMAINGGLPGSDESTPPPVFWRGHMPIELTGFYVVSALVILAVIIATAFPSLRYRPVGRRSILRATTPGMLALVLIGLTAIVYYCAPFYPPYPGQRLQMSEIFIALFLIAVAALMFGTGDGTIRHARRERKTAS